MRRRLLLISAIFLAPRAFAQEAFSYEVIKDFEMSRERLFDNSLLWLAETARSSKSVIDLKDKDLGTIIGTASSSLTIGWGAKVPMTYKTKLMSKTTSIG